MTRSATVPRQRHAALYRMVTEDHVCPYGLKSLGLLKHKGFKVSDHHLRSREETDTFKRHQNVDTTPQTFIDGKRIGGYDELRRYFGKPLKDPEAPTHRPLLVVLAMAAVMALAASWTATAELASDFTLRWFLALALCLLALQKLRDLDAYATLFLTYDLLGRRWVRYAWIFPFIEASVGLLMIANVLWWLAALLALVSGAIGAVSVYYAVVVQKRELHCACVGGGAKVPLGLAGFIENGLLLTAALSLLWINIRGQPL